MIPSAFSVTLPQTSYPQRKELVVSFSRCDASRGRPLFRSPRAATSRLTKPKVNVSLFREFIEVNYVRPIDSSLAAQFASRRGPRPIEFRTSCCRAPASPFSLASRVAPHHPYLARRFFLPENARLCRARLLGCRRLHGSGELGD